MTANSASNASTGKRRRSWTFAVGLAAGAIVGATIVSVALFERPGRAALHRLLVLSGLRASRAQFYAYHEDAIARAIAARTWRGVRSPTHPQWQVRPGIDIAVHAGGFTYPVSIAFAEVEADGPDAPYYYVTELGGTVKYVTRAGDVHVYATGLTSFPVDESADTLQFSGEKGLNGLLVVPGTRDLIVTVAVVDEASGLLKSRILYLTSEDGGRRMKSSRSILEPDEFTTPSHFAHALLAGPDGSLYASFGDSNNPVASRDVSLFAGKIVRLGFDGTPVEGNPFASGRGASSYVWASGTRNVFGMDFQPGTGRLYAIDNGITFDRLMVVRPGDDFAWDGHDDSTRIGAVMSWGPGNNPAPADIHFLRNDTLGPETKGNAYVTMFGEPRDEWARLQGKEVAPQGRIPGRSITELAFDERSGLPARRDEIVARYVGASQATPLRLAEGPDGLYVTDFYGESTEPGHPAAGKIWRLHESAATESLPAAGADGDPVTAEVEHGKRIFTQSCSGCHRVDGRGGNRGPDLSGAYDDLSVRLRMPGYEAKARALLTSESEFYREQRARLTEVLDADPADRPRIWLAHHLVEPRFDNPSAAMPSFSTLSESDLHGVIEYVMTLSSR